MIPAESIAAEAFARPLRFLWRTDADGRFQVEPGEFLTLAGAQTAALLGQPWSEVAERLGIDRDGAVRDALAAQATWNGIDLDWPIGPTRGYVQLSGFPIVGEDDAFAGYRGFGICDPSASGAEARRGRGEGVQSSPPEDVETPNVVPFRGGERRPSLSPVEQNAFQEIARTLEAFAGELRGETVAAGLARVDEAVEAATVELSTLRIPTERSEEPENLAAILASLSDTLRTPLHTIIGLSQLVSETSVDDSSRRYLSDIRQAGQEVLSALNGLLQIAGARSGALRPQTATAAVNPVVGECVSAAQMRASESRVLVRLSLGSEILAAAVDDSALRQLVTNLLSGVVQTTSAGGQIIVSTVNADRSRAMVRIRRSDPAGRDGQADAAQTRATPSEAASLALSLARAMAEASGARLRVDQQPKGALFELTLPSTQAGAL